MEVGGILLKLPVDFDVWLSPAILFFLLLPAFIGFHQLSTCYGPINGFSEVIERKCHAKRKLIPPIFPLILVCFASCWNAKNYYFYEC